MNERQLRVVRHLDGRTAFNTHCVQVSEIKQCSLKQEAHASLTHGSGGGGDGAAGRVPGNSLTNTGVPLARGRAAFTKASDLVRSDISSVENVCKTDAQTPAVSVIDLSDDLDKDGELSMKCPAIPHFEGISQEAESIDLTSFLSLQVDNETGTSPPPTVKAFTYPLTPTTMSVSGPTAVVPTNMTVHQVEGGSTTDSRSREAGGFVSAGTLLKGKSKMVSSRAAKDVRDAARGLTTASHREPGKM